ncbi:GPW/gp25 family protein [Halomonadaceae bacterium KBTZ08]
MSITKDRAWRFELPVSALATVPHERPKGLSLNPTGNIAMAEDSRAVHQSIILLLATRPGERLMRPDYGCNLHRLVFAPNDAGTAGLAIHYVGAALRRWEPRIAIQRLDAGADLFATGDETVLDIILDYRIRRTGQQEQLTLAYGLDDARLMANPGGNETRQGDAR